MREASKQADNIIEKENRAKETKIENYTRGERKEGQERKKKDCRNVKNREGVPGEFTTEFLLPFFASFTMCV